MTRDRRGRHRAVGHQGQGRRPAALSAARRQEPRRRDGLWPRQRRATSTRRSTRSRATSAHGLQGDPRAVRRARPRQGLRRRRSGKHVLRAGRDGPADRERLVDARSICDHVPKLFETAARRASAPTSHLLHDVHHRLTPIEAARLGKALEPLPPVLAGRRDAGREPGGVPADPPAHRDAARGRRGVQLDLGLQAPDREPADRLHPHDRRACRRHHAPAPDRGFRRRSTRCAPAATARPTCRRCAWARRCTSTPWVPNFGIQEYMRHTAETDAVFPHDYTLRGRLPASGRGARPRRRDRREAGGEIPLQARLSAGGAARGRHAVELVTSNLIGGHRHSASQTRVKRADGDASRTMARRKSGARGRAQQRLDPPPGSTGTMAARQGEATKRARHALGGPDAIPVANHCGRAARDCRRRSRRPTSRSAPCSRSTGPASFLGDPEKKTLEMYVADINAKGGINGQQVKLVRLRRRRRSRTRRAPSARALIEQDKVDALLARLHHRRRTMAIIPLAEEAQVPLINFAGAVQAVIPVKKWNFKTPHTDLMACEKIFEDLKKRNLTKIAHDLRHRCVRQVDARPVHDRDQQIRHRGAARGDLRPARQRHDPAAHQHQGQGRRAGGDQSGLRPGPGDRDAQLQAARHHACRSTRATASARSSSSSSRRRAPKACGCRPRRCWSPTSCPTAIRRRRSWSITRRPTRPRPASRSRPSAATCMTG